MTVSVSTHTHKILMETAGLVEKSNQVEQDLIEPPKYTCNVATPTRVEHVFRSHAGPIRLKFGVWISCDHECYYPSVFVVMGVVLTYFIQAATSNLALVTYTTFILCCTNTTH